MIHHSPYDIADYRRLVSGPDANRHMGVVLGEVAIVPPRNPPRAYLSRLIRWWFS